MRSTNEEEKISPDAILFEGCDYNHWLITMDFPKDPRPTPEEMVETYVQTAAKVLGRFDFVDKTLFSVLKAKKRIYACSTTTYHGFQVEVTEEMSNKFEGLPGVVFILPDSYIDPVRKEYGGDKYENGKITYRPPLVQFGRQGGRYNNENSRGQYQQGGYGNQVPNRNFGGQQNFQQPQNYGSPGANRGDLPMAGNNAPPSAQDSYQRERRDPVPPFNRNLAPPQGENYGQGQGGGYMQGTVGGYGQGMGGSYGQGVGQGAGGNYGQGIAAAQGRGGVGGYGQGAGGPHGHVAGGAQGQGGFGSPGHGAGGGYRQGVDGSYGQGQQSYSQGQNEFGQRDPREAWQGQQRNSAASGETGIGQGRY